jgi:ABC-type phosphate transport system substrate-binding protein
VAKPLCLTWLIVLLASACAGAPTATPTIPTIPEVGVSPFALPFLASLAQPYIAEGQPLPFDIVPRAAASGFNGSNQGGPAMYVDFSADASAEFATPLGWEGIAVIANQAVPIRSLALRDLADIYSGRTLDWAEFGRGQGPIQPVLPPQGESMRTAFLQTVMPEGQVTTLARLSPTPEQALRLTAELEGAIALAPSTMDFEEAGVSILRIEGTLPAREAVIEGSYPLRARIVAMAAQEPQGELRNWLIWAQQQDQAAIP